MLTGPSSRFYDVIVDVLVEKLNAFDALRIETGLQKAKAIMEENGPMPATKLVQKDMSAVIALLEALCSMPYLSDPERRVTFNFVFEKSQHKKVLKMKGGIIPIMTWFLFDDNYYRNRFARTAWESIQPESLSEEDWDWAVQANLLTSLKEVQVPQGGTVAPEKISRFWRGFSIMVRAMSEKLILERLRSLDISVWYVALDHAGTHSEDALYLIMDGLRILMTKSAKAFWEAYDQVIPGTLVTQFMGSPAFRPLLDKSLLPEMMVQENNSHTPLVAAFVKGLFRSLPLARRSDVCEAILPSLFQISRDGNSTREAQATCTLAGLQALGESLDGYLAPAAKFDPGTALIVVNVIMGRVVNHKDAVVAAAELKQGDRYNVGISAAAMAVVHSSLALDAKATWVEWTALNDGIPVQNVVIRNSGALWEAFLEMLWPGQVELAKAMLMATMPLRTIEEFIPPRREQLSAAKAQFNARYQQQTAAIGKILGRLTDFSYAELQLFCSDMQIHTIHPIVATLVHGVAAIREGGIELVKAITGETQLSEAVNKMLADYFGPFLNAFTEAVNKITDHDSYHPWSPMAHVLECSEYVLGGLCDPSVGQLRYRSLSPGDRAILQRWWQVSWECINVSFSNIRTWHERVEKKVMEDFCRDVMELADKFLAQDGVMVSALSNSDSGSSNGTATSNAMRKVLDAARVNVHGMVQMLQLRDKYLISGIVNVLLKLFSRLRENNMEVGQRTLASILSMCKKRLLTNNTVDFPTKTNLTDTQRVALLKSLGQDTQIELQIVSKAKDAETAKDKALRQSKLDFSKSGITPGIRPEALADVFKAGHKVERPKSALSALRAKEAPKPLLSTQQSTNAFKEKRLREQEEMKRRKEEAAARAKALRGPNKTVAGEGSGMRGVAGVVGKDHTPAQKDEIMIRSSDEEEDDDDDDKEEAELLAKHRAGTLTKDELERRQKLALLERQRAPVKKTKLVRSAKDMRARLIPPMDVLHQAILEWDIFHKGDDPPNGYKCTDVVDTYSNPVEYKKTFFPLLINEAWQSFKADLEELSNRPFGVKVVNRMTVDKFLEVTTMVAFGSKKERVVFEGDIVILSTGQNPAIQQNELHCLARTWRTKPKNGMLEVVLRLNIQNNGFAAVLVGGAELHAVRITNMTTIEREYAALESLQYYDLMDEILKAGPSPILNFGEEALGNVMRNYELNLGQARAILNAKENDGFTLIQGPPGTGKTKTIIAMVGCMLTGVLKAGQDKAVPLPRVSATPANAGPPRKKLLICAPSNAAVDELVLRLKQGVKTSGGSHHKVEVVRLGRTDAINAAVKDVTLDELVTARVDAEVNKGGNLGERDKLHQEAGQIKVKIGELMPALEAARASGERTEINRLQREYDALKQRRAQIGAKIEDNKSSGNTYARELQIKRLQIQQEILDKAQVLCATLSGSGHEMFKDLNVEFETVIIDEAAQCVELSALIPLKYGCSKCVLVGDPKQLPPTVLSQSASRFGYDQSLFVRMQKKHAKDVHLLDMQYRMHPEISLFPSREFYEGLLRNGNDMDRLRVQPWHQSALLGPYRFFDVRGTQGVGARGRSYTNDEELKVAMQLYQRFQTDYGQLELKGKIGIITPYKAQLLLLRQRFAQRYGDDIADSIEFNTTDAFQGRECEIIIFSCVRADATKGIGFLKDIRRMNVGLTRARSSLWILGDSRALVQGQFWARLIDDAKQRDRYTTGDIMTILSKPGPTAPAASLGTSGLALPQAHDTNGDVDMPDVSREQNARSRPGQAAYPYAGTSSGGFAGGFDGPSQAAASAAPSDTSMSGTPASRKRSLDSNGYSGPSAKKVREDIQAADMADASQETMPVLAAARAGSNSTSP